MGKKKKLHRENVVSKYGEDEWGWIPRRAPRYRRLGFWYGVSFLASRMSPRTRGKTSIKSGWKTQSLLLFDDWVCKGGFV